MNEFKHTPRPWKFGGFHTWEIFSVPTGEAVAKIKTQHAGQWKDEKDRAEANAHLIAAAPELLEAAKRALGEFIENGHVDFGECAICDASKDLKVAIAKAEGRA